MDLVKIPAIYITLGFVVIRKCILNGTEFSNNIL